jgi:hypothetical protein
MNTNTLMAKNGLSCDRSMQALKCQPTTYSAPMLRELLANRTLAFLGDSNARLVHALAVLIA